MWEKRQNNFSFQTFHQPDSGRNEYLLINHNEAATIDVSAATEEVCRVLSQANLTLKYLLVSHAHQSHLVALPDLKARCGGAFCLHKDDDQLLRDSGIPIEPDLYIKDNARLKLGDGVIRVLHTPGHTNGSVCFYVKDADILFSGRTLEKDGYGTIWGPTSMAFMLQSLVRLNATIYSATVYPGRGESTTMKKEAWLNCLRSH